MHERRIQGPGRQALTCACSCSREVAILLTLDDFEANDAWTRSGLEVVRT